MPEALRAVPIEISEPKQPEHGDFATNFALSAAKAAGMNPRALADALVGALDGQDLLAHVDVAGPGFLNFRLRNSAIARCVGRVLELGPDLARSSYGAGQRLNVEFVSVNPNGPITVGSGRGAAFGSTLCNVLDAAGFEVHREYYINDGVNSEQMRLFAESVRELIRGNRVPENGYKGDYVVALADVVKGLLDRGFAAQLEYCEAQMADPETPERRKQVLARHREAMVRIESARADAFDPSEAVERIDPLDLKLICETLMSDRQSLDLETFGVTFDTWFSEQALHDAGEVDRVLAQLEAAGVADAEPVRTKLKLAKGGKVEDVELESQAGVVDDDGNALAAADGSGATVWLRSTKFDDDMDRVLRRRDGRLTYIASDVAYHKDKFSRGNRQGSARADKLITILGPDHHGYIGRLTAVVAAMLQAGDEVPAGGSGEDLTEVDAKRYRSAEERDRARAALEEARRRLEVVIFQIVRFVKDGKPAPMRKRDGNIYALIDLIEELGRNIAPHSDAEAQRRVGRDVARFFYLMRSHDTHMDFDIDLATKQSDENPVFYVQYAHARICSVLAKAGEAGLASAGFSAEVLSHARELALIKKIVDLPYETARCAADYGVHRLATYAVELSRTYHHFYDACRVIQPDQPELTRARLALCEASAVALRSTLALLGVSAPERMDRVDASSEESRS